MPSRSATRLRRSLSTASPICDHGIAVRHGHAERIDVEDVVALPVERSSHGGTRVSNDTATSPLGIASTRRREASTPLQASSISRRRAGESVVHGLHEFKHHVTGAHDIAYAFTADSRLGRRGSAFVSLSRAASSCSMPRPLVADLPSPRAASSHTRSAGLPRRGPCGPRSAASIKIDVRLGHHAIELIRSAREARSRLIGDHAAVAVVTR